MYFSHLVLCDRREGQSSQERYEQQLAEVRLLDQLGYWACWFAEHHFMRYGQIPSATLFAASILAATSRITVGTAACVFSATGLPTRWPLKLTT